MCGIVAYLGEKNAYEIVIKGLQRLEYRGYDSSGVAIHKGKSVNIYKQKGKVQELIDFAKCIVWREICPNIKVTKFPRPLNSQ